MCRIVSAGRNDKSDGTLAQVGATRRLFKPLVVPSLLDASGVALHQGFEAAGAYKTTWLPHPIVAKLGFNAFTKPHSDIACY